VIQLMVTAQQLETLRSSNSYAVHRSYGSDAIVQYNCCPQQWGGRGGGQRVVGRVLSPPPFAFPQPRSLTTSCSGTLQPTPFYSP
jgi:hypothetical protein